MFVYATLPAFPSMNVSDPSHARAARARKTVGHSKTGERADFWGVGGGVLVGGTEKKSGEEPEF